MAARLYASGGAPTKRAACVALGLHPNVLTMYSAHNTELQAMLKDVDEQIAAKAVDMSAVLRTLEVKALAKMNHLLESSTEGMQFKAAQDLLDRGPNTGKIQKSVTTGLSIEGDDAKLLAQALFASRNVGERFREAVQGDFEKVVIEAPPSAPALPSGPPEK